MRLDLAPLIDHTLLSADATSDDIKRLCEQAKEYGFYAVCVNSSFVSLAAAELQGSKTRIASTVGFPLGAAERNAKISETHQAIQDGAHEIDMVMHLGLFREGRHDAVAEEIRSVVAAAGSALVKVIIECGLWNDEQIIAAANIVKDAGAHFVKTSTGFLAGGAQATHVQLLRATVGPEFGVKASGGIRNAAEADAMIAVGANRLGTSRSVEIIRS